MNQEVEECIDGGTCDAVQRGLPRCTRSCGIRASFRDTSVWNNIERLARAGNGNSIRMIERANNRTHPR